MVDAREAGRPVSGTGTGEGAICARVTPRVTVAANPANVVANNVRLSMRIYGDKPLPVEQRRGC